MTLIMAQYSIAHADPEWIVCPSEMTDIRQDVVRGIIDRRAQNYARLNSIVPHSMELHIRNHTKVHQVIAQGEKRS